MTTETSARDPWREGVHPLIDSMDDHLQTWVQWKDEFWRVRLYEHYEMFIRRGWYMDASDEECVERILIYLRMAEGHFSARTLERPDDRRHEKSDMRRSLWWGAASGTNRDWRRSLAHLAYNEFVYSFLRSRRTQNDGRQESNYPWLKWITDERVMTAFLHFFRIEDGKMPNFWLTAISDEDQKTAKIVTEILVNLSAARWHMGGYDSMVGKELSAEFLAKHKLAFLEILFFLKKLDIFEGKGMYISSHTKFEPGNPPWVDDRYPKPIWGPVLFDDDELTKLRELVMGEKIWTSDIQYREEGFGRFKSSVSDPRTAHSMREALCVGPSQAARVYVLICNRQDVDWRP